MTIRRIIEGVRAKKSRGNTLVRRFIQGIYFHTQREDGANISNVWSPQRNCHSHNAL